jgi:hypothetical protein
VRSFLALGAAALLALGATLGGCGSEDEADDQPSPLILEEDPEPGEAPPATFPTTATTNTVRVAGRDAVEDAAGVASAVFPATGDRDRPDAVVLVDHADWRGGVAASVLAGGEIGAPILLSDGDELPAVSAGTLARLDPSGAELAEGAEVIRIGAGVARPEGRRIALIAGESPFKLAAAIDRFSSAAAGKPSPNVLIASAQEAAFAMPAAAWAARSGDSVLFAGADSLPGPTREAIKQHEQPDIYVLGPESVISQKVEEELDELGAEVRRVAGQTPVENAIALARYEAGSFGWGLTTPGHNFTLASASRPLDAAASAALATNGTFAPLLLTDSALELPRALRSYLLDVQPGFEGNPNRGVHNRVWILGDQDVVSLTLQGTVDELTELIPVRIEGGPAPGGPAPGGDLQGGRAPGDAAAGAPDGPAPGGGGGDVRSGSR